MIFDQSMEALEELKQLKLAKKISNQLANSKYIDTPQQLINSRLRRDHLNPSPFDERKNISSYYSTYSPAKHLPNYNQPSLDKQLQRFRKHQNSTSALPNLPNISDNSSYQNSYQAHSLEKVVKGKQKDSWFLKMKWALDPTSNYQKQYLQKDGSSFNKSNNERVNYNHLTIMNLHEGNKRTSNYRTQFHPYIIKKQAQLSIGDKDHLASKQNVNTIDVGLTEYQRRYESVMQLAKPKQTLVSIYRKEALISRKPKLQI